MNNLSVIDPPFLIGLGLVTAMVFVASWFRLPSSWMRWGVRSLGVALPILMAASAVNARYAYLPTLAAVLGRGAIDQVSPARLRELERASAEPRRGHVLGLPVALTRSPTNPGGAPLERGVVVRFPIPATASHFRARSAEVYLPPAYFETPSPHLPVVELLHGTPGSTRDWTRGGFADVTADAYAAQHQGFAPVLVMPDTNQGWDSDSECVNGLRGQAQTYLTVDVRNAVIARFHTRRDTNGWAVAGLSEGAYCALQIGLRHPTLYSAIGDFSGENGPWTGGGVQQLFSGTLQQAEGRAARYNPVDLLQQWKGMVRPGIWFEDGTDDATLPAMANLDRLARAQGFDTRFVVQHDVAHSFASWRDSFRDALPWIAASFVSPYDTHANAGRLSATPARAREHDSPDA